MQKININRVTAEIIQDTRKALIGTELYSIKYRITYKGKKKYFATGKHLTKEEWYNLYETRKPKYIEIRKDIQNGFEIITGVLQKIFEQKKTFSFELVDQLMGNENLKSIESLFDNKIKELREDKKIGSCDSIVESKTLFKKFILNKEVYPSEITISFLKKFEKWMTENGQTAGGVGFQMRNLRTILNMAKKNQMISDEEYPFGKDKYQIPTYTVEQNTLTQQQIKVIMNEPCKEGSLKQKYRDLFLFSYFGNGMNIYDLCLLKYENMDDDEINFLRQKTLYTSKHKKTIYVPIGPELQTILNRWSNTDRTGYIFPFIPKNCKAEEEKIIVKKLTKAINQTMTRMGKKLKFGKITANTARHSYATNLAKSNTDVSYVSDSLGHTSLKSTQVYFAASTKEERKKNSRKL